MAKRTLPTPADLEAAAKLKTYWENKKATDASFTQERGAAEMNRSQGLISQYLNGSIPLGAAITMKFAEVLGISPGQIRDNMKAVREASVASPSNVEPGPIIQPRRIPVISTVAAGAWCEADDPCPVGLAEEYKDTTRKLGPRAYALRVVGDSMESPGGGPSFPEGCYIFVDPDAVIEIGNFVIAKHDYENEVTFKQYKRDGSRGYLKPLNPRYQIQDILPGTRLCARVMTMEMNF